MVECEECVDRADFAGCCAKHALRRIEKATKGVKLLDVVPARDGKHKYTAIFDDNGREKRVSFGLKGFNDFILYSKKDKELGISKRNNYWTRHLKDLRTMDVTRAGYLSLYILWNKPTLEASIKDFKKRFGI